MEGHETTRIGDRLADFVQRYFLWLLLGCYALATLWPPLGIALRDWHVASSFAGEAPLVPLVLLAMMLFCAALLTDLAQIRSVLQRPLLLCTALAAVWVGPALLVVLAGWALPKIVDGPAVAGLLVGLALVAAMPVANSSVGWAQNAGGNLALSLALVVLSISLSPLVTPTLLELLGKSLSPAEQMQCEDLVNNFSGWFFIVWVILPTAAGFVCRQLMEPHHLASAGGWIVVASAAALLCLNYINSAPALPNVRQSSAPLLAATIVLAFALGGVGLALGWLLARVSGQPPQTRSALMFGLSMKHTGLALVLAGQVLADEPLTILLIVLATLAQHLLAGIVQWGQQE